MYYTTISGDQWDMISYNLYGTEEHVGILMQANFEYVDIVVFPAGITLYIPELSTDSVDLPPWRSEIDDEIDDDEEFEDIEED